MYPEGPNFVSTSNNTRLIRFLLILQVVRMRAKERESTETMIGIAFPSVAVAAGRRRGVATPLPPYTSAKLQVVPTHKVYLHGSAASKLNTRSRNEMSLGFERRRLRNEPWVQISLFFLSRQNWYLKSIESFLGTVRKRRKTCAERQWGTTHLTCESVMRIKIFALQDKVAIDSSYVYERAGPPPNLGQVRLGFKINLG